MKIFIKAFTFYLYNHFVTHIPVYFIRYLYLQHIIRIKIGRNTAIHMGCFVTGNNIIIGDNTVINRNCYLDGRHKLIIGNNVNVSPECYLISLTHDVESSTFNAIGKEVIIAEYAWLGARCIVLPGVHLAKGCITGAGSVITKSFSENQIIGGVPGKVIGIRKDGYSYVPHYFPLFDTDI